MIIRNLDEEQQGHKNGSLVQVLVASSRSAAEKRSPEDKMVSISGINKDVTGDKRSNRCYREQEAARVDPHPINQQHHYHVDESPHHLDPCIQLEAAAATTTSMMAGVGGGGRRLEWPRIYLSLSRKEKEEDFYSIKGTKLPQRPKKRPKNIDKSLQYCFPGMWLSDLTRSRYEVREKKCVKKQKRRGLKGMESEESDSE